ncbi:hypothetical protein A8C64_24225 [Escherichia coli]|nr:hypothetical protein A8C64_24225 [Escherichia coli]
MKNNAMILLFLLPFSRFGITAKVRLPKRFALSAEVTGFYRIHIVNTHRQFARGARAKATLKTIARGARGVAKYRIRQPAKRRKCQYLKRASTAAGAGTRVSL